jgi:hypothetical protein
MQVTSKYGIKFKVLRNYFLYQKILEEWYIKKQEHLEDFPN